MWLGKAADYWSNDLPAWSAHLKKQVSRFGLPVKEAPVMKEIATDDQLQVAGTFDKDYPKIAH